MPRQPSIETQLRSARADVRRLTLELARAEQQANAYRARATQAGQEAAQWKQRFDILLVITKDGPKKSAPGVSASCDWREEDPNGNMPGTYESACGELWSFTDGGPKENSVRFCHGCGKPVNVIPFPPELDDEDVSGVTEPLIGASEPPGSVQCSVCKAITAPGNGCSAEDCTVGVKECECASGYCAREMGVPLRDSRCRTRGVNLPDGGQDAGT